MGNNKGLGRGFDSLIPAKTEPEFDPLPESSASITEIETGSIDPNPHQPRTDFNQEELEALAASIKEHGILQPVVVQKDRQRYQLVAGERRLRAAKHLGLDKVPAIIRSFSQQQSLELALIENIQREELNPVETATAYEKLIDQFNMTPGEVAKRVGRRPSTIKNTVRLLKLPLEAKRALAAGKISEGHARAILAAPEPNRTKLLESILKNSWTVRQAEEFARDAKRSKASPSQITSETAGTKALGKSLGTKVQLQRRAKGGRLLIHYSDDEDLERILGQLKNKN